MPHRGLWRGVEQGEERERKGTGNGKEAEGEGREERGGGGRGSWLGWWEGGWAGGTYGRCLPPRSGISSPHGGPRAERGFSQLCARAPQLRELLPGWCLPTPSTASAAPMEAPNLCRGVLPPSNTAGFHGNTSQFPHGDVPGTPSQLWGKKPPRSTKLLGENSPLPCFS